MPRTGDPISLARFWSLPRPVTGDRPSQKIHITNEIIHNPHVNERLKEMDVEFIQGASDVQLS